MTEKREYYRLNLKLPAEFKGFLQEMAWQGRTSITAYISELIRADMEAKPEWRGSLDELNR